jgi:pantoate--beta-alanine ligase
VRTVRSVGDLRAALRRPRREGRRIGLVPTMGAFHDGHLALIRRAREDCNVVVVSLFVNPAQFRPGEDLESYPRDEARDAALAAEEGADLLFAPPVEEIYPAGHSTKVSVAGLTEGLCGAQRGPEHFDGVTTMVAKLFNLAGPDVAFFGQKDAQQAVVVRRMARDLDFPVEIEVCPTVREPDGLAMSSRNRYLSAAQREQATVLPRALNAAEAAVEAGERDAATVLAAARAVLTAAGLEAEYLEIVHTETLAPLDEVRDEALVAVAAQVGKARLIDNATVRAVVLAQDSRPDTTPAHA